MRFSPDGKHLAARYSSGRIIIWNVSSPQPRRIAGIQSASPWAYDNSGLHFADNETLIDVPSRWDGWLVHGDVRALNIRTGRVESQFACQTTPQGMLYAAAGDTVALMDWPGHSINCHSLRGKQLVQRIPAMPREFALTPDGRALMILNQQTGAVTVVDIATGHVRHRARQQNVIGAAVSNDGRRLAVACFAAGGPACIRVLQDSTELCSISRDYYTTRWIAFTADGKQLAAAGLESAEMYDVDSGRRIAHVAFDRGFSQSHWPTVRPALRSGAAGHFSLSPDGRTLASFDGHRVLLWDLPSGKLRRTITGDSRFAAIAALISLFALWSAAWGLVARRQEERVSAPQSGDTGAAAPPIELRLCWGTMVIGGLVALAASITALFLAGPLVWPMVSLSLFTGVAAVSRGVARSTTALNGIAALQMLNLMACDPVNFVLGAVEWALVQRPRAQGFLRTRRCQSS